MSVNSALFEPVQVGAIEVPNRIFMAPLTRNRAHPDGVPKKMAAEYYSQRASAGLIISEATQISAMGKGYIDTPGIYLDAHVEGWKPVTDAVHEAGGRIFCQLWHVGRISHTSLLPDGASPVSSSDRRAGAQSFTPNGFEDCSAPIALDLDGILATVDDYAHAARMARNAGFDGVEIHAANGYLIDQFLEDGVNDRADQYGGSVENRSRFLKEVVEAVCSAWREDRVGIRLSPMGDFNDMSESVPESLFGEVYGYLTARDLAYLHVVERFANPDQSDEEKRILAELRGRYRGFYIANGGYTQQTGTQAIVEGHADAIAYGRSFISNPDLPERFRLGADLAKANSNTFYGGGTEGYIDYPNLERR